MLAPAGYGVEQGLVQANTPGINDIFIFEELEEMRNTWSKMVKAGVVAGCLAFGANAAMADGKWGKKWDDDFDYGQKYEQFEKWGKKWHDDFYHGWKSKNVIVMIPDGCDETVQTVAR